MLNETREQSHERWQGPQILAWCPGRKVAMVTGYSREESGNMMALSKYVGSGVLVSLEQG